MLLNGCCSVAQYVGPTPPLCLSRMSSPHKGAFSDRTGRASACTAVQIRPTPAGPQRIIDRDAFKPNIANPEPLTELFGKPVVTRPRSSFGSQASGPVRRTVFDRKPAERNPAFDGTPTSAECIPLEAFSSFKKATTVDSRGSAWARGTGKRQPLQREPEADDGVLVVAHRPDADEAERQRQRVAELSRPKTARSREAREPRRFKPFSFEAAK